jgi:hypothetical protein
MINNIRLPGLLFLLAVSFGFLGAISSESQAEPIIDFNDLTNRFSTRIVEVAVSAARSQVEIQYQAIVPNSKLGQLSIDGLVFTPGPELDMSGCRISVGRILFQVGSPQKLGAENITTSVYDLNVSPLCLPFEQRGILAMSGIGKIYVPHATININYYFPSSSMEVFVSGKLEGFSEFDLFVSAPYVSIRDANQPIVMKLNKAELSVRDDGAWSALSQQVPPEFSTPNIAGKNVSSLLKDKMFNGITSTDSSAFLKSLENTWNAFLQNPQQITLETGNLPSGGIVVDFDKYETNLERVFSDLKPTFSTQSILSKNLIDQTLLEQVLDFTPETLSNDQKLEIATAVLQGKGVPRNAKLGLRILEEMAEADVSEAFYVLANHYFSKAPQKAYFYAMKLGKANHRASTSFLDQLEAKISFDKVLELQSRNPISRLNDQSLLSSVYFIEQATSYYRGLGAERSYVSSYYWASLASASGARQGEMILANLHNLARNLSETEFEIWSNAIATIEKLTLEDWLGFKIAERINGE